MRKLAVLRPEPGNAATVARIVAAGHEAVSLPLFAVRALPWTPPDPAAHDAVILTSANTLRHGGDGLAALRALPVLAVGAATAAAARAAGFTVLLTGERDAAHLLALAAARGIVRALHLGGRDRTMPDSATVTASIAVYASDPLAIAPQAIARLDGSVGLLHSARAARRLGALVTDRIGVRIVALSQTVRDAAGDGWGGVTVAATPDDAALVAAAMTLAD